MVCLLEERTLLTAAPTVATLSASTATPIAAYTPQSVDNRSDTTLGPPNTSHPLSVTPGTPYQLAFDEEPTNAVAGVAIAPEVTVEVEDSDGNLVSTDTSNVTLTLSNGTFASGSATASVAAMNGIATFSDLMIDAAGNDTLTATDGTVPVSSQSSSFTISPAAAYQVAFGQQPTDTVAGVAMSPGVTVDVEDMYGNIVTNDSSTVSLVLPFGFPPFDEERFAGGSSAVASSGVATFKGLMFDVAYNSLQIEAFDSTLVPSAISNSFNVTAAQAVRLVTGGFPWFDETYLLFPTSVSQPFSLFVSAVDQFENVATSFQGNVTVAIADDSGATPVSGTTTASFVDGGADFNAITINKAGHFTLQVLLDGQTALAIPIDVTTVPWTNATPEIIGEKAVLEPKMKNRKPDGPRVLDGYELEFNTELGTVTATDLANYQIGTTTTKKVNKKLETRFTPITGVSVSYDVDTGSVDLLFSHKETFKTGGQLTVLAAPPSGIVSWEDENMTANAVFTISPGGKKIEPPTGPSQTNHEMKHLH
jgi:hypothetical protein